ncbi:MAG: histidine--tRNA ligase [Oscillospiraceae bacterium]|nr:histidine--tRNA ligase [Oscillospiraceae bacterium]
MKKGKIEPRTLSGFMELMPGPQLQFDRICETMRDIYGLYGYYPLDTPILESSEVLLAKAGGETEKQVYRFNKGDADITMRFDLTVPLAKFVAKNYGGLTFPFKRYQIGKVYRGEKSQKGRFREFYQSDIDIIGDGELNVINDAEIPAIIYNVFTRLGLEDFTIRLNNRRLLSGFWCMLNLEDKAGGIMRAIDKLEKMPREKIIGELEELGIDTGKCEKILDFAGIKGTNGEIISQLEELAKDGGETFKEGLRQLALVVKYIDAFHVPEKNYKIDLSIARGLDYYTGTVYETTFNKHPEIGSICSGGRYDNLAEFYTNKKLPGVGISIGLTRLFYILNEMEYLNGSALAPADVLVIPMTGDMPHAISISERLRGEGIKCQIYFEEKKFKAKIGYADKLDVPFAFFIGEDEIAKNEVSFKDMQSGEQVSAPLDDAVAAVKKSLSQRSEATVIDTEKTNR